jgi:glycosyltransferase involved in cell wall biosynthesis
VNLENLAVSLQIQPRLVWVYSGRLDRAFDSSTWLEMTRELRRSGWRVNLICFGQPEVKQIQGVEVVSLPTWDVYFLRHPIFHIGVLIYLIRGWSTIHILLFHPASAPWLIPFKILVGWQTYRPKWVMDTRTVLMEDIDKLKKNWKDRLRGLLYQIAASMANTWADGQTAITPGIAEKVNIPPDRLWGIWQSGVSPDFFLPTLSARRWSQEPQPIRLTYIGVMNHERNLASLCMAVIKVNQAGKRFQLALTGQGTAWQDLVDLAGRSEGMIEVFPPVQHEQIPLVLANAHVGVLPFPDQERFRVSSPLKLFEYLAAGMPILATRITCHTNVLSGAGCVFWAEDGSIEQLQAGLENIWNRRSELEAMGRQACLLAENFTWKASARVLSDSLLAHLEKILVRVVSS